jgi:SAM-dependent methyltransferase
MFSKWRTFSEFDVIHVHGGLWKSQLFYPLFKRRFPWKVLAVHYHGSETRTGKGLHHRALPDLRFYSTMDLARWHPTGQWIPNPIDLSDVGPQPENDVPRFGHFPSNPRQKGTETILRIFQEAFGETTQTSHGHTTVYRAKGAQLDVVSGAPHAEALEVMARCDAVLDQISPYGSYGMVGIEGMALGKPVLGTVNPQWYPGCPIVPLSGPEAVDEVRQIAADPAHRRRLGSLGREYVSRVHDSAVVARQVIRAYYESMKRPALPANHTKSYWTQRGVTYASDLEASKRGDRYQAQAKELLRALQAVPFEDVLEVGCGYGRIGEAIRRDVGVPWTGVDLSRDQLIELRWRSGELGRSIVQASAEALPFRDETFDLVLSVEMLMHIPPDQMQSVLTEFQRVAKGYVVHLDWYEDFLSGFGTGWNWMHDYKALWRGFGQSPKEIRVDVTGIQSIFVVPMSERRSETSAAPPEPSSRTAHAEP